MSRSLAAGLLAGILLAMPVSAGETYRAPRLVAAILDGLLSPFDVAPRDPDGPPRFYVAGFTLWLDQSCPREGSAVTPGAYVLATRAMQASGSGALPLHAAAAGAGWHDARLLQDRHGCGSAEVRAATDHLRRYWSDGGSAPRRTTG